MGEIDFSILDKLDIRDIQIACKNADIEILLKPIKERPDFYKKYVKQLGSNRPDKKSSLVRLYMPRIAFDLYQKGDETYKGVIALLLENYKINFEKALTECIEPPVSIEMLKTYDDLQLVELFFKVVDVSVTDISIEFYFMMLKLQEIVLDERRASTIERQIKQIETTKKEISQAVAKAEKKAEQKYSHEIAQLSKEKKDTEKKYSELKRKNQELSSELERLKKQLECKKEELTEQWKKEYDDRNSKRQEEEDKEFKALHDKRQRELVLELEEEESQKRTKLYDKMTKEEHQLQAQFEEKKTELDNEIEGLLVELQNDTDRKIQLDSELQLLKEEIGNMQAFMEKLKAYEKDYFENFEQRVFQNKVDSILLNKFGNTGEIVTSDIPFTSIVSSADILQEDTDRCEVSDNIADLFDDLCDNISVYFDEPSEISAILISAFLTNKAVVVTDDIAYQMACCVSALIDAKTPLMIQIGKNKADIDKIIRIINESDSQVVYLPGMLDDYDEISFSVICRQCSGKVLIAGVATMAHLLMMSDSINSYAITMDISNYIHFRKEQALWIGEYSIKDINIEYNESECKAYYNKYFRGLVSNHIVGKKIALDFCVIFQIYFELLQEQIGDVLKVVVSKTFDYKTNETANEIIEKSEFYTE